MDFRLPELGEGVYEAELVAWLVKVGDTVKRGQSLMEVMTDKATMEVPAPFAGKIESLGAEPGDQVKVGQVLLTYTSTAKADDGAVTVPVKQMKQAAATGEPRPPATSSRSRQAPNGPAPSGPVKAAPSVRLMARKLGIDLGTLRGSGPQGRILIEDLTARVQQARPPEAIPEVSVPELLRLEFGKPGTRIKLLGLRRKIAERMKKAKDAIPHYSYVDECDVTNLVRLRQSLKEPYVQAGVRLTYLAFLVKAVVAALKEVPMVNATLLEEEGEIVLHDRYHIGVAVATPGGLIVPVVHDADRKDLGQIAREIDRISADARANRSRPEDVRDGTFTITSIGNIGGLFSTPIINYPEVGIMGIGKVVKRPVFDAANNVRPADMLYLSFSFDHRVVDGAVGAAFGNAVIRQLQNPARLLLPEQLG